MEMVEIRFTPVLLFGLVGEVAVGVGVVKLKVRGGGIFEWEFLLDGIGFVLLSSSISILSS